MFNFLMSTFVILLTLSIVCLFIDFVVKVSKNIKKHWDENK